MVDKVRNTPNITFTNDGPTICILPRNLTVLLAEIDANRPITSSTNPMPVPIRNQEIFDSTRQNESP